MERAAPEWTLRVADAPDVDIVVALVESAYRGESSRAGWTTEAHLLDGQRTDHDSVAKLIAGEGSEVLLAVQGGEIVGCCNLDPPDPATAKRPAGEATAYFGMFAVEPHLQGAGIGRWLIDQAEQRAQVLHEAKRMRMTVIAQRVDLIAWYEHLGYRLTGERLPFPYDDERFGIPRRDDLEFVALEKVI